MTTLGIHSDRDDVGWLAESQAAVRPAMLAAIGDLRPQMRAVCEYQLGWRDSEGRPVEATTGKLIRPALTLTSAAAVGGEIGAALPAAVAVELMHNCTLLQDDVMDQDTVRRHRPAAWTVFGESAAVLAGDALLALSFAVLARTPPQLAGPAAAQLARTTDELIEGQALDLSFEETNLVSVADGERMSAAKTAALLGCACALGGLYAGAGEPTRILLERYGRHLGMAFQHRDDLLGIWGDPRLTGKPAMADLRRRKKSLPVVAALAADNPAAARLRSRYADATPCTDAELRDLADLVDEAGGRAWSERAARREVELARETLVELARFDVDTVRLTAIGRLIVGRQE
ncbi:polyprenyl synthetase family protein [Plantactinospora sp. S1510]|uniref:Polyprenyl synthetase family protein n=1 Tax=Plantactinospora alkalitolerans TaxID=2789879 RepID=A0ABS0GZM8_9ACTN|nr:polyprenyl synthetase family protein [Plantactinospora alkalitolerans]MBF9131650.1 polyprenyl synthetase family protein [Plantactinospora alkalitolerans]